MHKRKESTGFTQLNQKVLINWISLIVLMLFGWIHLSGAEETELILSDAQGSSLTSDVTPEPTPIIIKNVVLDPGHGGKNHGIIVKEHVPEKQLALQIALQIKKRLKRYKTIDVFMTRQSDMDLPIMERVMKCNRNDPDVFVSIHSIGIAAMSNQPDQPIVTINKFVKDDYLAEIAKSNLNRGIKVVPWDLAQNRYIGKSKRLANKLSGKLFEDTKPSPDPHELPLAMLTGIRSAAVLLELPNKMPSGDEMLQKQYVEEMAQKIADGIVRYLY